MSAVARRLFAMLIRILPPSWDEAERRAISLTVEDRWRDAHLAAGRGPRWRFLVREAAGLLGLAMRERFTFAGRGAPRLSWHFLPRSEPSRPMSDLLSDLRFAARSLPANKSFSTVIILTLALGIGANATIFSVVNAVLLRPLPYPGADRLMDISAATMPSKAIQDRFRVTTAAFDEVLAYSGWEFAVTDVREPRMVSGGMITTNFFDILGGTLLLGRQLLPADSQPGNDDVVLLGEQLWRSQFGADPEILGRRIMISNEQHDSRVVIGVMAAGSPALGPWQLWVPAGIDPADEDDYFASHYLNMVGRLAPSVTRQQGLEDARATFLAMVSDDRYGVFADEVPEYTRVTPMLETWVGGVRTALMVLLAAVAVVLLIACTNVANLLLARASTRTQEVAIRTALGASRSRIVRQMLTESMVLSLLGALVGALGARWLLTALRAGLAGALPRSGNIEFDATVAGFVVLVSVAATALFGLVPALRSSRQTPAESLAEGGRSRTGGRATSRLQGSLVVAEVAMTCLLVVSAALLARSLMQLRATPTGFNPEQVLTMRVTAPSVYFGTPQERSAYWDALLDRVGAVPGVQHAGSIQLLPLQPGNWSFPFLPEGFLAQAETSLPVANYRVVSAGYFTAMGMTLRAGRAFTAADRADSEAVVVVNEQLARTYWPGESALGKELKLFGSRPLQVIGVVGDVRQHRIDSDGQPEMYQPYTQFPLASMTLAVRTNTAEATLPAVLATIRDLDDRVPVHDVDTMANVMGTALAQPRLSASLLAAFAVLAMVLGAVGVYGVVSYSVGRRSRELGIRLALGANGGTVARSVVFTGMRPVFVGVTLGMGMSLLAGRMLQSVLYETPSFDPLTYLGVAAILGATALLACALPARRAARIDPLEALRAE